MILTCPDCATGYLVEDADVGPTGRTVKCSACGTVWREGAAAEAAPAAAPETLFVAPRAARVRRGGRGRGLVAAAIVVLVVLLGLLVFRAEVARLWPSAAGAYRAIGLPVDGAVHSR